MVHINERFSAARADGCDAIPTTATELVPGTALVRGAGERRRGGVGIESNGIFGSGTVTPSKIAASAPFKVAVPATDDDDFEFRVYY